MSRYLQHNEMTYELHDNEQQRQHRRAMLRVVYALADPNGWDARKVPDLRLGELRAAFHMLKEVYASQQAADHSGDSMAGHVPEGPPAHAQERVPAGLP